MGLIRESISSLRRLDQFLGNDNRKIARNCVIVAFIATAFLYTIPFICGKLIDHLVNSTFSGYVDVNLLLDLCTAAAILIIFWYVAISHSNREMNELALKTGREIRTAMNHKMMNVPVSYVDNTPAGELTARFTTDLPAVIKLISSDYIGLIVHISMIVAIFIMMLVTSLGLAVLYILLLPLTILFTMKLTKKSEKDYLEQREKEAELNNQMSDIISSHRTIKSEHLEKEVESVFNNSNNAFTRAYVSARKRSSQITPIIGINVNAGYLITVVIGAIMMLYGSLEVGMFLTFMFYVRAMNKPLMNSATNLDNVHEEMVSLQRILDVLEAPEEEDISEEDVKIDGSVRFEDVHFTYPDGTKVLNGLSFEAREGEITALVGRTGSGKTTAANLLMNFYSPDSGRIMIGGRDVRNIPRNVYKTGIAAVLQDPWVFDGTIRENIIYNREGISEERMLKISRITGLDDYVSRLPDGYDTVIGNDIRRLPLAQRRMLAITRAFIGEPKVLILDEAVAGLDPITGTAVFETLIKFNKGRTIILITHNKALQDRADRVVMLDHGRTVNAE